MLKAIFLMKSEKLINSILGLDPYTQVRFEKLQGKAIAVTVTDYRLTFYIVIENKGIRLQNNKLDRLDAEFSASSWDFMSLLRERDTPYWELTQKINTKGSIDVIQELHALLQETHIDWEEYLSFILGDVVTHKISSWGKKLSSWFHQIKAKNQVNLVEYLHYEKNYLPPNQEVKQFFHEVRQLNYDVDRLEAHLNLFAKKQATDE